jgi:hypothetical protein
MIVLDDVTVHHCVFGFKYSVWSNHVRLDDGMQARVDSEVLLRLRKRHCSWNSDVGKVNECFYPCREKCCVFWPLDPSMIKPWSILILWVGTVQLTFGVSVLSLTGNDA